MKYSWQRQIILETIQEHKEHLAAQQIYGYARERCPHISLGTVYRNLNVLVEHGMLAKLELPGGSDHFEANTNLHYHVQCTGCGRLYDVELPLFGWLDDVIAQKTHIKADSRYFLARGLCSECTQSACAAAG